MRVKDSYAIQYSTIHEADYIPEEWEDWEVHVPARALIANNYYNNYLEYAEAFNIHNPQEYADKKVQAFLAKEGPA